MTGRQVEVLDLLTEGLTDAETAGHHVSALLAKLGISTRRDAATAARRLGLAAARHEP